MTILHALGVAIAVLTSGAALACEGLRVEQAWIRQPPPGAAHAAAYFTLRNEASHVLVVDAFTSTEFASVMLHETRYKHGRSSMVHLPAIELAPGASFRAGPGGAHLMLGGAQRAPVAGMLLAVDFHCGKVSTQAAWFEVRRTAPGSAATP